MRSLTNSVGSRDRANHLHSFTNLRLHAEKPAFVIERGEGVFVIDEDGKRYLEGMSGLWCASLGFSEPRLVEAAHRQMQKLPFNHTFRGRTHAVTVDLADRLLALAPSPMSKVFFASSGSEANDSAIKIAWHYNHAIGRPERRKLISRHGAYHGTTVATTSLSGMSDMQRDFNLPIPGILYADKPHFYREGAPGETEEQFVDRIVANLEALILSEGPETIAAFFAEPVMGVGGVIVPPKGYFAKVQTVLRKYDILFVADEIICGFGRTGNWWGCQAFNIEPDILVCAKSLSSAYLPISALLVSASVYDALLVQSDKLKLFAHGFTYSGHPVPAAVALEALNIYEERDIVSHVRVVGTKLQTALRETAEKSDIVGEVRGVGLMAALELVSDLNARLPFDSALAAGSVLAERALEHGLIIRALGNTVVMAPPLIITEAQIGDFVERLTRALAETRTILKTKN